MSLVNCERGVFMIFRGLACLFAVMLVSACETSTGPVPGPVSEGFQGESKAVEQYKIGPGDQLQISVWPPCGLIGCCDRAAGRRCQRAIGG